jgi:hypothetical protein
MAARRLSARASRLVFLVRDRSVILYVTAFAAVQQIAYTLLNVPGYHWYFASFDVATVLAASYCVGSLFQIAFESRLRAAARPVAVALYISVLAFACIRVRPLLGAHYPRDQREVSYQKASAVMIANRIPAGPIAAVEVGTLGYYLPDHSIVDVIGLTSANPEYATGKHNDQFFAALPSTVLFHAPSVWPTERAIFEDIRFRMLYERPVVMTDVDPPMQYFRLRRGARPPGLKEIAAYVEQQYPPFQEITGAFVDAQPSVDAVCFLDSVNGQPASRPVKIPRMLLSLTGWAYDRGEPGTPTTEVFALVTSGGRRYSMRATRVARPDVAAAFKEPRFEMSGYELQGAIVQLPPGDYRVSILQKRGAGFASCDVPAAITIADAVR